jgi:hypothetical protein
MNNHKRKKFTKTLTFLLSCKHGKYGVFSKQNNQFANEFAQLWRKNHAQHDPDYPFRAVDNGGVIYNYRSFVAVVLKDLFDPIVEGRYLHLWDTAPSYEHVSKELELYLDFHDTTPDYFQRALADFDPLLFWQARVFDSIAFGNPRHVLRRFSERYDTTGWWYSYDVVVEERPDFFVWPSSYIEFILSPNSSHVPLTREMKLHHLEEAYSRFETARENSPQLYRAFQAASIRMNAEPNNIEAFDALFASLAAMDALPSDFDVPRIWRVMQNDPTIAEDQETSIFKEVYEGFTNMVNERFQQIVLPVLLTPACLALSTCITSLISIFKDGSYIAGTGSLVASLVSFVFCITVAIYGPLKMKSVLVETEATIRDKIAGFVFDFFGKNADVVNTTRDLGIPTPDWNIPPEQRRAPDFSKTYGQYFKENSDQEPASGTDHVDEFFDAPEPPKPQFDFTRYPHPLPPIPGRPIAEEQASHVDIVKLALMATGVLGGAALCIAGGQTARNTGNIVKTLTGVTGAGLTLATLYQLIVSVITDDGIERRTTINEDLTNLNVDIMDFLKRDDAYLATEGLERVWDALTTRFVTLQKLTYDERDNNTTQHFKDLQLLYYKAQSRYNTVHGTMVGVQARVEPVFVNLYGAPGAGKSTFVNTQFKPYLCAIEDADLTTGCIEFSGSQKYAPVFNDRPIAIMDEYMQGNPDSDDIQMITNMISSTPFKCDGAAIEQKNQYFNAEIVVTMSNRGTFIIPPNVCPAETIEAFWSRHNFFYCIREKQYVERGRTITPGSYLRLFHSTGHTPSAAELAALQAGEGKDRVWHVPEVLPEWLKKEYTLKEFVLWVTARLVANQNRFVAQRDQQRKIFEAVNPNQKIVERHNLDPDHGRRFPPGSVFDEDHPMRQKVEDIFTRMAAIGEVGEIPERMSELPLRLNPKTSAINVDVINNEIPSATRKPIPQPTFRPVLPFGTSTAWSTTNSPIELELRRREIEAKLVAAKASNPVVAAAAATAKKTKNKRKPAVAEDQLGFKPLVFHSLGDTNTGKSYSWDKWMSTMAYMYNMRYVNTKGQIPTVVEENTIYLLDDVLPARHEEYCQFWEKCGGANIICLTSNMSLPTTLGRASRIWNSSGVLSTIITGLSNDVVSDCRAFPSEKLIRRAGVGGKICFGAHIYDLQQDSGLYHQISRGTLEHEGTTYSDVNIRAHLSTRISTFLNCEPEINWALVDQKAPADTLWDFHCTLVPEKMHTITREDFIKAGWTGKQEEKMLVEYRNPSSWKDPAIFVNNRLVPAVMPRPEEAWVKRDAFSGIVKALLPQKQGFKFMISFGNNELYCLGDDMIRVKYEHATKSTWKCDDTKNELLVKHPWEADSIRVHYDDVVIMLFSMPSQRAKVTCPETRMCILNAQDELAKIPYIKHRLDKQEEIRSYIALRERAAALKAQATSFVTEHPIVCCLLGVIVGVGALYTGAKLIGRLIATDPSCDRTDCDREHYRLHCTHVYSPWYHTAKEALKYWPYKPIQPQSLETDAMPVVYMGLRHISRGDATFRSGREHCHQCPKGHWFWHMHDSPDDHEPEDCPDCGGSTEQAWTLSSPRKARGGKPKNYDREKYRMDAKDFTRVWRQEPTKVNRWEEKQKPDVPFVPQPLPNWVKGFDWKDIDEKRINWADDESYFYDLVSFGEDQALLNTKVPKPSAMTGVEKKVMNNMVSVSSGLQLVKGLMLKENMGVTVGHIGELGAQLHISCDEVTCNAVIVAKMPERDLALFKIESAKSFKDITSYFADEKYVTAAGSVKAHFIREEGYVTTYGVGKYNPRVSYSAESGQQFREQRIVIDYMHAEQLASKAGDCGTPYFLADARLASTPIVGIHCTVIAAFNRSIFCALTRQDIDYFLQGKEESDDVWFDCGEVITDLMKDNLIGTTLVCDEKTADILQNLENVTVHDVGEPTKCFPIGFSRKLAMPAGWKKNIHNPAPWTEEIAALGFENTCAPAASSIMQMEPEHVEKLNKDHRGNPSIAATRMAAANKPLGTWIPAELEDTVVREMGDHYYGEIIRFGGFRVLNTYEIINGVKDITDPLHGIMPMEMNSSAGLFYNKAFAIHKKAQLFRQRGETWEFSGTPAGKNLRERFGLACRAIESGKTMIDFSNVKLKNELRPLNKIAVGKTRAFESEGIVSYMILKKYLGGVFESMTKARHSLHCTVGCDSTTESSLYYQRFQRFQNIFGRDHVTFDKSIMERIIYNIMRIFMRMWDRAFDEGYATENHANKMPGVFGHIAYSIESLEGTMLFLLGAINSGIFGTCHIDSMAVDFTTVVSFKIIIGQAISMNIGNLNPREHEIVGGDPTLRNILEHADWIDCGDDNLTQVSDEYAQVVNYHSVAVVLGECFGIECTPPNKDAEDYDFGTLQTESFCSSFFIGTFPFVTWALKKESIERQLFWCSNDEGDDIEAQMIYGVMPSAVRWQDRKYYNKVRRAVRVILARTEKRDMTLDYDTAITQEKQRLGLLTLSSGSDLFLQRNLETIVAQREEFENKHHTKINMVYKKCETCQTECSSYTAYWKHLANSHPDKSPPSFECKFCDKKMDINSWKLHEHPSIPCVIKGCVAKPRNLAAMDYHSVSHHLTMKQCYTKAQEQAKMSPENLQLLQALGGELIMTHLEQAGKVMKHLGEEIVVQGKFAGWKENAILIPDLGMRRISYKGETWETAERLGYFGEVIERLVPVDSDLLQQLKEAWTIVRQEGTSWILSPKSEEQSLQIGMAGAEPIAGAMVAAGSAANAGALDGVAMKMPPGIVDSQNTVAALVNLNTMGADPRMIDIGGRNDNLYSVAMQQKQLLSTVKVASTMASNTLLKTIKYGAVAGRLKQWMDIHRRVTGSFLYEIQVVGNGMLSGSIGVSWFSTETSATPPPPTDPAFYDVNFVVMAINTSSSALFQLNDVRKNDFYRDLLSGWVPADGFNSGAGISIWLKDEIVNPSGAETSITINIYVAAGPDLEICVPRGIAAPGPEIRKMDAVNTITLANIIGPNGFLVVDQPFPSTIPNAESIWFKPLISRSIPAGYASLISFRTGEIKDVQGLPVEVIKDVTWSGNIKETPCWAPSWFACHNGAKACYARITTSGNVTAGETLPRIAGLGIGFAGPTEALQIKSKNADSFVEEFVYSFMNTHPHMTSNTSDSALRMNVNLAYPWRNDTLATSVMLDVRVQQLGEELPKTAFEEVRVKVPIQAPAIIYSSGNFALAPVGNSPYLVGLNVSNRSQPAVWDGVASDTVALFTDDSTYAFLSFLRSRAKGQSMLFSIRDMFTNRVVAECVYDWDTGMCVTSNRAGKPKWRKCTLTDMTRLSVTDFVPTSSGSLPRPIDDDLWLSRQVNVGDARIPESAKTLQSRWREAVKTHYEERDEDTSDDDEESLYNIENYSLFMQTGEEPEGLKNWLSTAGREGKHVFSEACRRRATVERIERGDTAEFNEKAEQGYTYDPITDKWYKELGAGAEDQSAALVATQRRALGRRDYGQFSRGPLTLRELANRQLGLGSYTPPTVTSDKVSRNAGTGALTMPTAKGSRDRFNVFEPAEKKTLSANDIPEPTKTVSTSTNTTTTKARAFYGSPGPFNHKNQYAPGGHGPASSFLAGGAALGNGLANVAGGIGGMVLAVKEHQLNRDRFELDKDLAHDNMQMQQNQHSADYNKAAMLQANNRAAGLKSMGSADPNFNSLIQLGKTMTTNYESQA